VREINDDPPLDGGGPNWAGKFFTGRHRVPYIPPSALALLGVDCRYLLDLLSAFYSALSKNDLFPPMSFDLYPYFRLNEREK